MKLLAQHLVVDTKRITSCQKTVIRRTQREQGAIHAVMGKLQHQ